VDGDAIFLFISVAYGGQIFPQKITDLSSSHNFTQFQKQNQLKRSPGSEVMILVLNSWRPQNKGEGLPEGLRGREGWRYILLGWYILGRRYLGTWIVVGAGKPMRD
jgi:hypothetical protein